MNRLFLVAVLAALVAPTAAHAQNNDPCFGMDTTPWNPGAGWQTVGDCAIREVEDLFFDAAGTLYGRGGDVDTLDTRGGAPGAWRRVVMPHPSFNFTGMLPLSTPDSLVGRASSASRRTTDRHATWPETGEGPGGNMYAAPPGVFRAHRLFASNSNQPLQLSDDRGGSWRPVAQYPEGYDLQTTSLAFYPAGPGPWGQGYSGRTIAAGFDYGVALSDDGGDTWRRSSLWPGGRYFEAAVLARPASEGGGLRAVVVGVGPSAPNGCAAVWTSDDGGDSWTARAPICEPCSVGSVCAVPRALLPLARRLTGGAPVSGPAVDWPETEWETTEAVALMSLGGLFRTTDGGATWTREQIPIERPNRDSPHSATLSPDGRLYVGTIRAGATLGGAWVLRTTEGLIVARDATAPAQVSALSVAVRPNPSAGGSVAVTVTLAAPSSVRVVVVDAVGREVARLHDGPASGALTLALATGGLAPGIYTVRATAGSDTAVARLTVTR